MKASVICEKGANGLRFSPVFMDHGGLCSSVEAHKDAGAYVNNNSTNGRRKR